MTYLLAFVASGGVVVLAGTALARHGDAIAEATKIGRVWIGAVLLAGATSLPCQAPAIAAAMPSARSWREGPRCSTRKLGGRPAAISASVMPSAMLDGQRVRMAGTGQRRTRSARSL